MKKSSTIEKEELDLIVIETGSAPRLNFFKTILLFWEEFFPLLIIVKLNIELSSSTKLLHHHYEREHQ